MLDLKGTRTYFGYNSMFKGKDETTLNDRLTNIHD